MGKQDELLKAQIASLLILSFFILARSDNAECQDSWLGLGRSCSPYIRDDVRDHPELPSDDCCQSFVLLENNTKCLCLLIEDRNESTKLGFSYNISLALNLTVSCKTHTNISQCIDLLNLSPNSPEAMTFKQIANSSTALSTPLDVRSRFRGGGGVAGRTSNTVSMRNNWMMEKVAGIHTIYGLWPLHLIALVLCYYYM
ncbi:hypothetical protein H6P81_010403 [Aristolochia fimbriata]|uniref:Bifunctional inhibitor/plant lipid transfer protein/seed storage helical domain-containing protein n=1 Tax=Aristolochia fimbriata TaxID=158543 RepID=A0AAV7ET47_ARIFI|nr:hypothetical protein H6P81_010403 [Aristolochia fimbriata]